MFTWLLMALQVRVKVLTSSIRLHIHHLSPVVFLNPSPFLFPISLHSKKTVPLAIFSNPSNLFLFQSFRFTIFPIWNDLKLDNFMVCSLSSSSYLLKYLPWKPFYDQHIQIHVLHHSLSSYPNLLLFIVLVTT